MLDISAASDIIKLSPVMDALLADIPATPGISRVEIVMIFIKETCYQG